MDLTLKNNSNLSLTTLPSAIGNVCRKIFVKDCPYVSGIGLLRACPTLNRVRVNLPTSGVSGSITEIYGYAGIGGGYNDSGEDQTKPRIVGTYTINDYFTQSQVDYCESHIDGIEIIAPSEYNLDAILNSRSALQTLDTTKPNYNPAVSIMMHNLNKGTTIPLYANNGKWFLTKTDAAQVNNTLNFFQGVTSVTDTNAIVSSDDTQSYDFTSFDEFQYFTRYSSIPNNCFAGCSNLQYITLPSSVSYIGNTAFSNSGLVRLTLNNDHPYSIGVNAFNNCTSLTAIHITSVENYLKNTYSNIDTSVPLHYARHLYMNGQEVTSVTFPTDLTVVKQRCLQGGVGITSVTLHDYITTIGNLAFQDSGITHINIPSSVTAIGEAAFLNAPLSGTVIVPSSVTSMGQRVFGGNPNLTNLVINNTNFTLYSVFCAWGGAYCGDGTGCLKVTGNYYMSTMSLRRFKIFYIGGNLSGSSTSTYTMGGNIQTIIIKGTASPATNLYKGTNATNIKSLELDGQIGGDGVLLDSTTGKIIRLGYNGIAGASSKLKIGCFSKVYLGDGSTLAHDQSIMDIYMADTDDWATQSSKLGLWYNYHGTYRTYTISSTLTSCTLNETNVIPYIMRGSSYQATVVPNTGYTNLTVKVEMMDTTGISDSNPATSELSYTDITNSTIDGVQVYNSTTHEINIPAVTGNVIITATAS